MPGAFRFIRPKDFGGKEEVTQFAKLLSEFIGES